MKVWLYYRLSRDEDEELNSLNNQRKIIYNFAVSNGHEVVGESFDDNVSGMHFNREGIDKIYEVVEAGKIEAIIVKDLSRLGRHRTQTALFIDYLREHDVRVLSATENIDTFNENDDLIIGFKGLVNDFYAKGLTKGDLEQLLLLLSPFVPHIVEEMWEQLGFAAKYGKEMGINNDARYVPFTSHVPFGKVVSATPNGGVDWFPLSDGSSASHGADVNGPTAVLLSNYNTKNMGMRDRFARMLNIKFTPKCVEGEQGTEKLVSFIRTFCDLKLWHVQFNVVNKSTLLAAQKDPQKYRNLIVRIAGYSAYFVDLSPDLQNDLIARTEHDTI